MTPTVIVRPRLKRRAAGLGVNPISFDTIRIRSRVCSLTIALPFIAREAVATLTPAPRATSRIVTAFFIPPRGPETGYIHPVTTQANQGCQGGGPASVDLDNAVIICHMFRAVSSRGWSSAP